MNQRGVSKVPVLYIDQCCVVNDPEIVKAMLTVADEVQGYKGLTVDKETLTRGKVSTWTDPSQVGPAEGDSNANYKKARRKPTSSGVGPASPTSRRLNGSGGGYAVWQ